MHRLGLLRVLQVLAVLAAGLLPLVPAGPALACYYIENYDGYQRQAGAYRFVMLDSVYAYRRLTPDPSRPYSVSGLYTADDPYRPVWSAEFAGNPWQVLLSADGHHAAVLGGGGYSRERDPAAVAVTFYRDGRAFRRYTVGEVAQDIRYLGVGPCAFGWLDELEMDEPAGRLTVRLLGYSADGRIACMGARIARIPSLAGVNAGCTEGDTLTFDLATGDIVARSLVPLPAGEPPPPRDGPPSPLPGLAIVAGLLGLAGTKVAILAWRDARPN